MKGSMRPDWTRATVGAPFEVVARIHEGQPGARTDLLPARNRVSVVRPGALQPKPEDEYELSFVFGPEATNADVHNRTVVPLLKKAVEGYNVTILTFGATGSGKTHTLEGLKTRDLRGSSAGDGIVHYALDELFELLHAKAVAVGEAVAQKRRMPTGRGFDFFVECSFAEVYNEECRDLLAKPSERASLPIVESVDEGFGIAGLTSRSARNASEMRGAFNAGRAARDGSMMDLGSVHERSAAIFTVYLAQYAPAAVYGEEDRLLTSKLTFVDMPGAERLAMDAEVLRLREGLTLNKSLTAFAATLRTLAAEGSAEYVNYGQSALTKLLSDALGGNSLAAVITTLRQGEWELSAASLKHVSAARAVRCFPVVNHSRARGLLHKLRYRCMAVLEEMAMLQEKLAMAPAAGDHGDAAMHVARLRDLEGRLLDERDEKAALLAEKQALAARLAKLKEAGTGELREKAELQSALVHAEEQRLEVARALIDFQLEYNETKAAFEGERYALQQRIMELEAKRVETHVKAEEHAALMDERNKLASQLISTSEETDRLKLRVAALERELAEEAGEVKRLSKLLTALEIAGEGRTAVVLDEDMFPDDESKRSADVVVLRKALQQQMRAQERRLQETSAALQESQAKVEALRTARTMSQESVDKLRDVFKRKLEAYAREVAELTRIVGLMQADGHSKVKLSPEAMFKTTQRLLDDIVQTSEQQARELRSDLEGLEARHGELGRRFKLLYAGYRTLRYRINDEWPGQSLSPPIEPMRVPREETIVQGGLQDVARADENASGQVLSRLRERNARLESEVTALRTDAVRGAVGLPPEALAALQARQHGLYAADPDKRSQAGSDMEMVMQMENARLREELDRLRRAAPGSSGSGAGGRGSGAQAAAEAAALASEVSRLRLENDQLRRNPPAPGGPSAAEYDFLRIKLQELERTDRTRASLAHDIALAKLEVEKLKAALAKAQAGNGGPAAGGAANGGGTITQLRKQVQEFTLNTQFELERRAQAAESRAVMAEEQLEGLQKYMAQASVTYQREIMRLRAALQKADPSGHILRSIPAQPPA